MVQFPVPPTTPIQTCIHDFITTQAPVNPPSTLNEKQADFFVRIINAFTERNTGIFAINGSPGTGKTHLTKAIYAELLASFPDCKILCGAMTGSVRLI